MRLAFSFIERAAVEGASTSGWGAALADGTAVAAFVRSLMTAWQMAWR